MKKLLFIAMLLALLPAALFSQQASRRLSPAEKALILGGDTTQTMCIWLITSREDSVFLRQKCAPFALRADRKAAKHLAQRMLRTVQDSMSLGVGIAAPQVGVGRSLVLVQRFDKPNHPFEAYYNISIISYSAEKQPCPEGCLSIPNQRGTTLDRAQTIRIRYQDLRGRWHEDTVSGFTAVIFQHEVDHLLGILFTDHLQAEAGQK